MVQAATGVTSFDVQNMLTPMSDCVQSMQYQISKSKLLMLQDMHRDPVPQYSSAAIQSATQFLEKAAVAMQSIIDGFKAESLKSADEDSIKMMQEKCRESARKLVLLFGDSGSKFQGDQMKGGLVSIQESSQAAAVRERLASVKSFFDTFATAEWLGQLFSMRDFKKELDMVCSLLDGLLNPKAALFDIQEVQGTLSKADAEFSKVSAQLRQMMNVAGCNPYSYNQYGYGNYGYHNITFPETPPLNIQGSARKEWSDLWLQWHDLKIFREQSQKICQQRQQELEHQCGCGDYDDYSYNQGPQPSTVQNPNPLSSYFASETQSKPVMEQLQCLTEMCAWLKNTLEEDERKKAEMKACLTKKMSSLAEFAQVLNDITGIVKRYVLTRLVDIRKDDLSILKRWVTHEEATEVHKTLEAFRDDAIEEMAVRRFALMMKNKGSNTSWQFVPDSDSSSVRDYLFQNSVGYAAHEAQIEEVDEGEPELGERADEGDHGNNPKKLSKHQRQRRAKFRASIPRTPSSGTYQS
mmetsp:Transcript_108078/g.196703  ORF Transcript_108078/g.196703 Transcript_108078/m.196703 type:complete len:523 (-) Transcript_108078:176-1744(-)